MLELTLSTLLTTMSSDFCQVIRKEKDVVKSALISYSMANKKYGPENVMKVIKKAHPIEIRTLAVSSVITKCPDKL